MQTIILTFIIPVIALIFTAVFGALWWQDKRQKPVLAFAAGYGSMALAVIINILIFEGLDPAGFLAYHFLSMGGMIAIMWGLAQRGQVKAPLFASTISVLITSPILWYAIAVDATDAMKMAQNTNSALVISLTAVTVWYGTKRSWADHAIVWVLAALAGFGFVRPLLTIFFEVLLGPVETTASVATAIHVVALSSLLTLLALCMIASILQENMRQEREDAAIDPLSGLLARRAFEQEAEALLAKASAERKPVSMIVADIDHFKRINDTFGHAAGDKVIASFSSMIRQMTRDKDITGRIGGEEFCILVANCDQEQAIGLADRLCKAVPSITRRDSDQNPPCAASFGVAAWRSGESYGHLFERADAALYEAKRSGRNRVHCDGIKRSVSADNVVQFAR